MASAYYNENDPKMAAWLRELIKAGVIVPGEVDERSIWDVVPSDVMGFTQCHFFAGQGSWSYALRQAGWSDDRRVWTGSCPCQDFSGAGKRAGLAGERHLWPAWFHFPLASRTSERMVRGSRSRLPFNAAEFRPPKPTRSAPSRAGARFWHSAAPSGDTDRGYLRKYLAHRSSFVR